MDEEASTTFVDRLTLYSKPGCGQCIGVKAALDRQKVEYDVRDVTIDEAALNRVKALGYQALPVIETPTGEHWQGFRPDKLSGVIAAAHRQQASRGAEIPGPDRSWSAPVAPVPLGVKQTITR